jgi:diguanylate cyclase (GGDEF)-like protein
MIIIGMGAVADIVFKEGSLVWSCFTAAVLYMYFFIIQSDLMIDSLTGIGNRSGFNEFINKLSRQNSRLAYSIVMIDLDKFKEINDNLGHLVGDNALRDIAVIIKSCIRHSDFAARYGGDEFVLATEAENDIQRLMDRIQESIDLQNKKHIRPYQLYISYGYDVFETKSGETISDFLAKIDAKMYKEKEERKKRGIPSTITANLTEEAE